ncbi:MAG: geranylgeranylglyceryl/heptaprenylglyceryl phosphate synthase [Rhodothermales bacterium]
MDAVTTYDRLVQARDEAGAGFIVLIDPDKTPVSQLPQLVEQCVDAGVDALFIGGSLLHGTAFQAYVSALKALSPLPIIGFPGSINQIAPDLDAILYLSIVSGRNPDYLFGRHIQAAPIIKAMNVEPISTGYMLVESGHITTALYMSNTMPLPRRKPDVAAATALAAEMMGMRMLFTDGGSGADQPVPIEIIAAITETCTVPLIVGGGLRTPDAIETRVAAGAGFVVVGTAFEQHPDTIYLAEMVAATRRATAVDMRAFASS